MGCTVIVCTDGRKIDLLARCIDSISRQTYQELEITCVSKVENLPDEVTDNCKLIVEKRSGVSLAKNIGIRASKYDKIALTDDDCICEPDWVENLVSEFSNQNVGCVTGGSVPTREGLWYASTGHSPEREVFSGDDEFVPPWDMGAGNNVCFRKEAVVGIGLYDENLGPGTKFQSAEDIDVFYRILKGGYRIVYTPKAVVRHEPLDTLEQVKKMMSSYRFGIGAFFAKNQSSRQLRRYFLKVFLKGQLRHSRNSFIRGDATMGNVYLRGFLAALKGYLKYAPVY
ncbi:MAG: glycosyltransferase [Methanobacteriota archaeon]|nr:MAG: glycosyltransferase [Euryarchaeota archaeon]